MPAPPEIAINLADLAKLEHLVTGFSLVPRQAVHSILSGKHASKLRGRGLDFSEVRKYVHGDDIRNIDWKVTARTRVTHTKVFNEEKERPTFVIVDQSSSMFFASQGSVKSVLAAQLAAIAGFSVLKNGDRFGGIVFNDSTSESVRPQRSRKTLMHFLEQVTAKNQELVHRKAITSKGEMINKVLFRALQMLTHDYVVVVISDFLQLDEEGFRYFSNIARHNDVIAAIITDPMEQELPEVKMPIGNGMDQVMVPGSSRVNEQYKKESDKLRNDNLTYFRKYGIPLMEFNTTDPLVDQIKKTFGRR